MKTFEETFLVLGRKTPRIWIALGKELGLFKVSGSRILTLSVYRGILEEGRSDIFRLKESKILRSYYRKLVRNYKLFQTASKVFQYMRENLPLLHPAKDLLKETEAFLKALEDARGNYRNLYMLWLYKFHAITSGGGHLHHCAKCGSENVSHFLKGIGLLCKECAPEESTPLTPNQILILRNLNKLDFRSVLSLKGDIKLLTEIMEDVPSWHSS